MRSRSDSSRTRGRPVGSQTFEPQCNRGHCQNCLYIVGIGPGHPDHLTRRAFDVLSAVDAVVGYRTYLDLIRPLVRGKHTVSTGMTKEVERVETAIDLAQRVGSCAIVSSGDPGIYAMAGLVFEICKAKSIPIRPPDAQTGLRHPDGTLQVEVVPGIPALCAGAALLGAPLTHDFAAISLSDLLTPWELIEQRLEAAARADFVIVLYNPKSKKRTWQLEKARQILLNYRDKNTPVGVVVSAMREGQEVHIITLENLHTASVNMQTIVFIGSRASMRYVDFMVTPRGYTQKYRLQPDTAASPKTIPQHITFKTEHK